MFPIHHRFRWIKKIVNSWKIKKLTQQDRVKFFNMQMHLTMMVSSMLIGNSFKEKLKNWNLILVILMQSQEYINQDSVDNQFIRWKMKYWNQINAKILLILLEVGLSTIFSRIWVSTHLKKSSKKRKSTFVIIFKSQSQFSMNFLVPVFWWA
jgi:hypothetical protein